MTQKNYYPKESLPITIGDKIHIIEYGQGILPNTKDIEGVVESIDMFNNIHGTWGEYPVMFNIDKFYKITDEQKKSDLTEIEIYAKDAMKRYTIKIWVNIISAIIGIAFVVGVIIFFVNAI